MSDFGDEDAVSTSAVLRLMMLIVVVVVFKRGFDYDEVRGCIEQVRRTSSAIIMRYPHHVFCSVVNRADSGRECLQLQEGS